MNLEKLNMLKVDIGKFQIVVLASLIFACSPKQYVVEISFQNSPVPAAPDYSNPTHWASLPSKKDAADSIPNNIRVADKQATAKADVFFVYPTIFTGKPNTEHQWNASLNDELLKIKIQQSTILNQASLFNGSCRIYSPYYRQAHLDAFYTKNIKDGEQALELAYQDVKSAFIHYLNHFNGGRPIVLASHSQGSYHAERLMKDFFDGKPLQTQLVAAYLIGRGIRADAFSTIRPTERADDIGVWASWNTFARGFYPLNYNQYFKEALSTNPLLWNSSDAFAPKELNLGGVGPKFRYYPQLSDAQNHAGLLWINKPYLRGRVFIKTKRWHYADINLFYLNTRENVQLRVDKYLKTDKAATDSNQ